MTFVRLFWHIVRRVWRGLWRLILLILLLFLLSDGAVRDVSLGARVTALARPYLFDYASWEIDALWGKARQELLGVQSYLDEDERKPLVLDYLSTLAQVQAIEWQIEQIYADPSVTDPAEAVAALSTERDALRRQLAEDQPLVEGIIEEQVSAVLVDEGFDILGQVLPPVSMHFTEIPMLLVVSPRDRIEFAVDLALNPLALEDRQALETVVDSRLNVSSLTAPLGGISLYPSMIVETSSPPNAFEITAHEWAHHYLMFFPLGLEYELQPDTRIINETVATFFGREIGLRVLARYYPEVPLPEYADFSTPPIEAPFDYAAEMNTTRLTVDQLLAEGKIEEAEDFMEQQRQKFVQNGYLLRKLNQAYFAFYGGYQGEPGAGGTDPIGPAVQALLDASPNLHDFLESMRGITTREQLTAAATAVGE